MPWYKTGTVSVAQNSNAVTGSGTAFIANARVGDAFRGPDGGWYEVTNIASNTAMSISPNYQGANNAAGTYALAPMQGYVKDSADALRSLVNQFGAKLAALGTTGNYDTLPLDKGGTGQSVGSATELLNALGAMPGAGGSYTPRFSNLRLTAATAAGAGDGTYIGWNDTGGVSGASSFVNNKGGGEGGFSFRSVNANNTVGGPATTLSYSGILNVPAGFQLAGVDLLLRGSNVNGSFSKYADGTLICEFQSPNLSSTGTPSGNAYIGSTAVTMVFPHAFLEAPVVAPTCSRTSATAGPIWSYLAAVDRSSSQVTINAASFVQNATGYCGYIAKGRWK
jgi:hypothetical protein